MIEQILPLLGGWSRPVDVMVSNAGESHVRYTQGVAVGDNLDGPWRQVARGEKLADALLYVLHALVAVPGDFRNISVSRSFQRLQVTA